MISLPIINSISIAFLYEIYYGLYLFYGKINITNPICNILDKDMPNDTTDRIKEAFMTLQQILSPIRKAVDDYHMIEDGDTIAVGISGGKDSLTLLNGLHALMRFYPHPFQIHAVTVDLGFDNLDLSKIKEMCERMDIPYTVVSTEIASIVFEKRKESNPCSLCAKMRKGALNQAIKDLGCNKVAYAHHKDDVVETMLMSLIYEGRFHTFSPVTHLDRMNLTVIRPLIYMNEADVIGYVNKNQIPVVKSPCPADGYTRREYIKNLLRNLNRENPGVKDRMFTAILNGFDDYLIDE